MGHGSMHGAWQGQCTAHGRAEQGRALGLQGNKGLRRQSERVTRRADCKDVSSARAWPNLQNFGQRRVDNIDYATC